MVEQTYVKYIQYEEYFQLRGRGERKEVAVVFGVMDMFPLLLYSCTAVMCCLTTPFFIFGP